ncbi:LIM and calponin homology domains-containing protein 1 isoform X10 [Canis lupus familiaris]|uniref:LIM and calponin homology domains-containing protein 1 isoform X10 n=1 Tax=Canis lupus familiaris TaxID=9615 RepID=UPI000BAA02C3|nr:LIM and calponin homology domains-containing protein 1 isoform X10 [Canis lupus familiaris]XP_038411875.1 LIM and calponin homology domains-containing protein 1 isoform X10 [Canis lupus familiaris]XP_038541413.1 LIM and calponin homology domains-containing protein 1 isoform X10 [Canis lupus familiaris]|eukprot:XP_022282639.1 LIM and calponin homology domains-containing protein 1 isoform X7 [Canis lupus familiaris]
MLGSPCFVQTLPSFTHGLRHTAVIRCLKRCSINITHPQGNATQNRSETSRHTRWDGDGTALESGSSVALSTLEEIREQSSCPPSMDKEQVTGRSFGDKDFRTGLENGILLCELLNAIKPGLVKKINRLPTPIAGLDNIILFLRGCKELGLRESQLFDPSDLQDTSNRVTVKSLDYSRKLKNVLVTIYWLGKAANSSASYSGTTLNLKEFEGLLAQMRKETDDIESPKRSIRDSGYIDCWDSERSDSLSPPRHGRDDSFDSLDSFGSRSRQTPSPDVVLRGSSDGRGSDSESDLPHRKLPDVKKDDMSARRTSHGEPKSAVPFNQYLPNKSNQTAYVPAPLRRRKAEREEYRKSWSTATSPLGGDRPCRSSSLLDMRCEEEAAVQPHSRARQEQLQLINSQLREEDDKWQDDLARWKSRRRSASQDLIKKEEERKKMEKLLAGEDGTSERRKSIKTYREIVQEKERRERELHEAYKNARSQEEAEGILQQYIERFTISEAVLERLEMPKILERSHSTEPNLTPFLNDPNPMKYLRRQSLPPPKFTATVETTIARTSVLDTGVSAGGGSPSKTVPPKAVPMLTPKPYSQPKNSQDVLKTFKVDGKVSMNGEAVHGDKEKERECPTVAPAPSLTKPQMFEAVARVHGSPVELKQDNNSIEINIKKPSSVPQELRATTEETEPNSQEDENDGGKTQKGNTELAPSEPQHFTTTVTRSSPTVPFVEFPSSPQRRNDVPPEEDQKKLGNEMSGKVELVLSQKVVKPKSPEPEATLTYPFLEKMSETNQLHLPNLNSQVDSPGSEKSPVTTPFKFWAWDPEEERRRQEKWQQEQERLLQERYQKEQNKLKEEWEKAQKEVEEEERRYYEEERKIIEDTVVPFTLSSSSADQLSTSSSVTEGTGTVSKMDLENCREEEQETKQKKPLRGDDSDLMPKTREDHPLEGKGSLTQGALAPSKNPGSKGVHQDHQLDAETGALRCGMNSQLAQDPPQNTQVSNPPMHVLEDVKPKTLPLDKSINHQIESPSERRKKSPRENFQAGHLSPCSPTPPGQSPNRSISGKKLCSSCGLPLGKGAAMIIETLQLYFHIQCFRCGLCKGQLGDAVSGTDVRIRSGLLNCNDCYLRSRSAGQPTTL